MGTMVLRPPEAQKEALHAFGGGWVDHLLDRPAQGGRPGRRPATVGMLFPVRSLRPHTNDGTNGTNIHQGRLGCQVLATHPHLGQRFLAGKCTSLPQAHHLAQAKVPGQSLYRAKAFMVHMVQIAGQINSEGYHTPISRRGFTTASLRKLLSRRGLTKDKSGAGRPETNESWWPELRVNSGCRRTSSANGPYADGFAQARSSFRLVDRVGRCSGASPEPETCGRVGTRERAENASNK